MVLDASSMFPSYFKVISGIMPTEKTNIRKNIPYRNKSEKSSRLQKGLGNFNIPYICPRIKKKCYRTNYLLLKQLIQFFQKVTTER